MSEKGVIQDSQTEELRLLRQQLKDKDRLIELYREGYRRERVKNIEIHRIVDPYWGREDRSPVLNTGTGRDLTPDLMDIVKERKEGEE